MCDAPPEQQNSLHSKNRKKEGEEEQGGKQGSENRRFPQPISAVQSRSMAPIVAASQLATGLGVLAGAMLVKSALEHKPMSGGEGLPRCPSCNGTGRVSCLCKRWSDGDVGCRTCAGSGRMGCGSCGGSGTGRPIPVQVSVRRNPKQ
ncbi:hypothetical protein ACLOJK_009516 [Asimina triloba]